jgi:hypothetical protein
MPLTGIGERRFVGNAVRRRLFCAWDGNPDTSRLW